MRSRGRLLLRARLLGRGPFAPGPGQAALDRARDGDVVLLRDGVYPETREIFGCSKNGRCSESTL